MSIPINIEILLSGTVVEGTRLELKEGWNPTAVMRTVCAFANDFENEGSGYIVIGVQELNGKPQRPVLGFNPDSFERVQKEMIGFCNLFQPNYMPRLSLEEIDKKHVLVIWVPAGSIRPYKVPDDVLAKHKTYNYRIRQFSSSIIPNAEQEAELVQLTARIPFDDRVNTITGIENLSFDLMRGHLAKIKSKLFNESATMTLEELAVAMNLCEGAQEHLFPKNVGLLMFSENPKQFFPGVQIDVVEFPYGLGAKEFNEKTFDGAIQIQLTNALSYIQTNIIKSKVKKYSDRAEADKIYNYPYEAIEEALANAVYHRNYELREPIEVRVLPEAIEIISYNGIDPSLKQADFEKGIIRIRRYRNRRIGGFLKELELTEGRGTGIPTIIRTLKDNGSPAPVFDTDEPDRRYFVTEIPIHPDFLETEFFIEGREENLVENETGGVIGGQDGGQGGQDGGQDASIIETLTERQKEVLNIIVTNPRISRKQLAEKLGINESAVQKHTDALKKKGAIERESETTGQWIIIAKI